MLQTTSQLFLCEQKTISSSHSKRCLLHTSEYLICIFRISLSLRMKKKNLTIYNHRRHLKEPRNNSVSISSGKQEHTGCFFSLTRVTRKALIVHAAWQSALYSSSRSEMNCCAWGGPSVANVDATLDPRDKCLTRRTFISSTYSLACCSNRW